MKTHLTCFDEDVPSSSESSKETLSNSLALLFEETNVFILIFLFVSVIVSTTSFYWEGEALWVTMVMTVISGTSEPGLCSWTLFF